LRRFLLAQVDGRIEDFLGIGMTLALGLDQEWPVAIWAGLILIGVGVVWGLLLYFAAEAGSPFD
jgi:hypothetical protein